MAADGLLLPEEIQVGGPVPVLRLLEKAVDAGQCGRVVVAGEPAHGVAVLGRLLHRPTACGRCCAALRLCAACGKGRMLPLAADEEEERKGKQS